MENWLKTNGLALLAYIVLGSVAYGNLDTRVDVLVKDAADRAAYVPQVIELKGEMNHVKLEAQRNRDVWVKLDETLDTLNNTLNRQGGEITALKDDVDIIKRAVIGQ